MTKRIQYTIFILAVIMLISLGIGNISVPAAIAVNPQTLQEIQTHLTEVQTALDNNDVEGAKMHLNLTMEQLTQLQNKVAEMKSSAGSNTTTS